MDEVPGNNDDWDFEDAGKYNVKETVCVLRQFQNLEESFLVNCRKPLGTFAEAVRLADELSKQVAES